VSPDPLDYPFWLASRSAGVVAYLLLSTSVVLGLARWAARRGARWCYLQVETANLGAHAAYARLGFVPHHRYHYLAQPALG